MQILSRDFDLNFSTCPGRIHNTAVFLSDFIKFSKSISISLDVALIIGDFLFSGGLFSPSFGRVDDELMFFYALLLELRRSKGNIEYYFWFRKVSEFEGDTQ